MPWLEVIVLGLVQGLTEFLPISSTAHLALIPWLFHWRDPGLGFDIALHAGTLAAILIYFFRDWVQIVAQGFGIRVEGDPGLKRNPVLLWLMAVGTLPVGLFGYIFKEQAETTWRNPNVIAAMLIAVGILLWICDRLGRRRKDVADLTPLDAIYIGLAQAFSIVPGTSRSGITIAAGLWRNLDRPSAARFSFLLSTPAIAAAALKDFYDLNRHQGGIPHEMRLPFLVGILVSGVTGLAVIHYFLGFLQRRSLNVFVAYRVVFGIIVIALAHFFGYPGG
ncbi:MAG TPA: undecaprenyl-diphosphatase UppP [Bryobacteraceae bacterium]|nr:undecaprenyl-diphosphatase UppP [Bryobacteraceae bacterium]